jgi:hypothetical protein
MMPGRLLARFGPSTPTLNRVWRASTASTVRLGKFYKTKVVGRVCFSGADHIVGPEFWIRKDLGPMCFPGESIFFLNLTARRVVVRRGFVDQIRIHLEGSLCDWKRVELVA